MFIVVISGIVIIFSSSKSRKKSEHLLRIYSSICKKLKLKVEPLPSEPFFPPAPLANCMLPAFYNKPQANKIPGDGQLSLR